MIRFGWVMYYCLFVELIDIKQEQNIRNQFQFLFRLSATSWPTMKMKKLLSDRHLRKSKQIVNGFKMLKTEIRI